MRIFIVENHADTLDVLKLYLEDLGHKVDTATTVADALAQVPAAQPDLLICDIGLPDGSGWELLERLASIHPTFAVAMSGFGMSADNARSRAAGFRYHLLKPFKMAEVDRILDEAARACPRPGERL